LNIGTERKARASLMMAGEYPFRESLHFTVITVTPRYLQGSLHEGPSDVSLVIVTTMDGFEVFRYRYGTWCEG
jgi:hypothetical protein